MKRIRPRIAIIGAGLGGATAAILLERAGYAVSAYEQAAAFARVGAGIHLARNVMEIMRHIGLERRLRATGFRPEKWLSRDGATGEVLLEIALGHMAEQRYGASYLTVHRGDFHDILTDEISPGAIRFNKRLVGLKTMEGTLAKLSFQDGSEAEADLVIGADGLNSKVRELLLGPEKPRYSARLRTDPRSLLRGWVSCGWRTASSGGRRIDIWWCTTLPDPAMRFTWSAAFRNQKGPQGRLAP